MALAALAAVGERDICADGDPSGAAALVLQAGESGWALHTEGPRLRKALASRLMRPGSYRAVVEADTRPTSFVFAGLGLRWPVASTPQRPRCGGPSRCTALAGPGPEPFGCARLRPAPGAYCLAPSASARRDRCGSPALFPGDDVDDVAAALQLVPATVLAFLAEDAARMVDDLDEAGAVFSAVTTVLLVGAPKATRSAPTSRTRSHGVEGRRPSWRSTLRTDIACYGVSAARADWGCTPIPTLSSYSWSTRRRARPTTDRAPDEVVLTQLGFRGSALLRWRTADLADSLGAHPAQRASGQFRASSGAQACPRARARAALRAARCRPAGDLGGTGRSGRRRGLADRRRPERPQRRLRSVIVHVVPAPTEDPTDVAVAVARDVRSAAGLLPTQVVQRGGHVARRRTALAARARARTRSGRLSPVADRLDHAPRRGGLVFVAWRTSTMRPRRRCFPRRSPP